MEHEAFQRESAKRLDNSPLLSETVWLKQNDFELAECLLHVKSDDPTADDSEVVSKATSTIETNPLMFETVWMNQKEYEDAECLLHVKPKKNRRKRKSETNISNTVYLKSESPLALETVWLEQTRYEEAECLYQMRLTNSDDTGVNSHKPKAIPKTAKKSPAPVDYGKLLGSFTTELLSKCSTTNTNYTEFNEIRQAKVQEMHESLLEISLVVQECVKRLGTQIALFDNHMESSKNLLDSLESTVLSVQQADMSENKPKFRKSLYKNLTTIDSDLDTLFDDIYGVKFEEIDQVVEVTHSLQQVNFVQNLEAMANYTKTYSLIDSKLKSIQTQLSGGNKQTVNGKATKKKESPILGKVKMNTKKTAKNVKANSMSSFDSNESLNGSLGSGCLNEMSERIVKQNHGDGKHIKTKSQNPAKQNKEAVTKSISPSSKSGKSGITHQDNQGIKEDKARPGKDQTPTQTPKSKKPKGKQGPDTSFKTTQGAVSMVEMKCVKGEGDSSQTETNSSPQEGFRRKQIATPTAMPKGNGAKKDPSQTQLRRMHSSIQDMLKHNGPDIELQDMLTEAGMLLNVKPFDAKSDYIRHRFSLLQMAYNHRKAANDARKKERQQEEKESKKKASGQPAPTDKNGTQPSTRPAKKSIPCQTSSVDKIGSVNPCELHDKNHAGISSIVILDCLKSMALVDIINGCIKLYDVGNIATTGTGKFMASLPLYQPYYMTQFLGNKLLVSRADQLLSLIEVKSGMSLKINKIIKCEAQYYGLGWIKENMVACAHYEGGLIDLVRVNGHLIEHVTSLRSYCDGPELLSIIPNVGSIIYLDRCRGQSMHLTCIDMNGDRMFQFDLGGTDSDVWNLACIEDKIICCNKQTNKMLMFTNEGRGVKHLPMPIGSVKMPFAICFSEYGHMYVANDAAWEVDRNHFVTTEINVFAFIN